MPFECMVICVLSPAHESEMRGYLVYVLIVERPYRGIWGGGGDFFETFLEGSVDHIIYRDFIANRRSFMYCSLACTVARRRKDWARGLPERRGKSEAFKWQWIWSSVVTVDYSSSLPKKIRHPAFWLFGMDFSRYVVTVVITMFGLHRNYLSCLNL